LRRRRDYFVALSQAIVSQQLAVKAAATIFARFRALFPRNRPTPLVLLDLPLAALRGAGLSGQKSGYLRDLAARFTDGTIPSRRISRMTDEQVIASLTQVKGVGVWTAEMFLIFVLNRPDIWPVDDLGVRKAAQRLFELPELPTAESLSRIAEPWRPYRTVAAWYLWRSLENKPMG
jgi:DNA-3-methyladenine glycosylase II